MTIRITRRAWMTAAAASPALRLLGSAPDFGEQAIRARIRPPRFPNSDFAITKFGARPEPAFNSGDAVRKAIEACAAAGGGRVVVPAGVFLTGAIHLRSGVELHLSENATLRFSTDPRDYLPVVFTRWEGTECMNYSPLIYAFEQDNIAVTGSGTLDGQGDCDHWWGWSGNARCGSRPTMPDQKKDRELLHEYGEKNTPVADRVFGEGHFLRTQFIQPYRCNNVLIEGVKIRNSPMWEVHPVLCRNVTVRGLDISTHGPNNDGCDPESCTDVLIEGCTFDTGDDCIAIKSGRNGDGRRLNAPCENIVIANCSMKDGHGGVSIGSEASGSVRNVYVRDCRMSSPHLERALRIKTNSYRGGTIENVIFAGVTIGQVADDVVQIDFSYEEGEGGPFNPIVRNIELRNVTCERAMDALSLKGYASDPIRNVRVIRSTFNNVTRPNVIEHVEGMGFDRVRINGRPYERA